MQITSTERISWKTWMPESPEDFPCMICHQMEAEYRVKVREGELSLTLCVCPGCNTVPALSGVIDRKTWVF